MRGVHGERGLADPRGAVDRTDRRWHAVVHVGPQQRRELGQLGGTAGEGGHVGRELARYDGPRSRRPLTGQIERRVRGQHPLVQFADHASRLGAELADQPVTQPPVRRQRLGLPAGTVQREHPVLPQPLAQRVLLDQRAQLDTELGVLAEREPGLHQGLGGGQPAFLRDDEPAVEVGVDGDVLEGPAAPQREPPAQLVGGGQRIAVAQRLLAARHELLEREQVEIGGGYVHPVAGCVGDQPRWRGSAVELQLAAQRRHVCAQRTDRGRWRPDRPDDIHQPIRAQWTVGAQQQHGEDGAQLRRAEPDRLAATVANLQWPEHPEPHSVALPSRSVRQQHKRDTPPPGSPSPTHGAALADPAR